MAFRRRMTTTRPIRKMIPIVLPRNLSMGVSRRVFPAECGLPGDLAAGGDLHAGSVNW
jgi:hypothetical protein